MYMYLPSCQQVIISTVFSVGINFEERFNVTVVGVIPARWVWPSKVGVAQQGGCGPAGWVWPSRVRGVDSQQGK